MTVEIFIGRWVSHERGLSPWLASLIQSHIEYKQGIPARIVADT